MKDQFSSQRRAMSRRIQPALYQLATVLALAGCIAAAWAQNSAQLGKIVGFPASSTPKVMTGRIVIPESSQVVVNDIGKKAHTNVRFMLPDAFDPAFPPPGSGYAYETPQSLACAYAIGSSVAGCNPLLSAAAPTGGSQTIAIVDAFDNPEAASDLAYFSAQFGLPFTPSQFRVVYAGGVVPPLDVTGGWELEEALDVEYAHAMAPSAHIYLVEATSNSYTDLFTAVQEAINIISCGNFTTTVAACGASPTGKGEISMSWGGGEFSTETTLGATFAPSNAKNVVFLAAAGDVPGPSYPAADPNVIAVGGTTLSRSLTTGNLQYELAWSDAGGGISSVEPAPSYQTAIATVASIVNGHRGTPDVALDANPYTGVYVYDSFPFDYSYVGPWFIVGGTSVSTPVMAGIINNGSTKSGVFSVSTAAELTRYYNDMSNATTYPTVFRDITYGACNYYSSTLSAVGYDLCTGVGSVHGLTDK